ncbi:hypothetical protein M513_00963, partial [Trichuris suis]
MRARQCGGDTPHDLHDGVFARPQPSPPHELMQVRLQCAPVGSATQLISPVRLCPQGLYCLRVCPHVRVDEILGMVNTQVRVTVPPQAGISSPLVSDDGGARDDMPLYQPEQSAAAAVVHGN